MTNIKQNVWYSEVRDWNDNLLMTFEGVNCEEAAINWREEQAHNIEDEDEAVGILEDLYIISYNVKGEEIPVEF